MGNTQHPTPNTHSPGICNRYQPNDTQSGAQRASSRPTFQELYKIFTKTFEHVNWSISHLSLDDVAQAEPSECSTKILDGIARQSLTDATLGAAKDVAIELARLLNVAHGKGEVKGVSRGRRRVDAKGGRWLLRRRHAVGHDRNCGPPGGQCPLRGRDGKGCRAGGDKGR